MRSVLPLVLLAACLGPTIVQSRDDGTRRTGTVWYKGREGYGDVDARRMAERHQDAEREIARFCDGGYRIVERRHEDGVTRDNYVDFECGAPTLNPCVEAR